MVNKQWTTEKIWRSKSHSKTHDFHDFHDFQKSRGSDSRKKNIKFNWIICNNHKFIDWKTDSLFLFKVKFGWIFKSHSSRKIRYNVATEKEILEFNHKKVREGRKKLISIFMIAVYKKSSFPINFHILRLSGD